jgi:hypothetical protein
MATAYQPLAPRARATVIALSATIAVDVVAFFADGWQWTLLDKIDQGKLVSTSNADISDTIVAIAAVLQLVLLIATAILFLRWFKRAYENVDALGGVRRFSPGWAVGSWFVPLLNLWRPKQITNDIWHASSAERESVPAIVNVWWTVWIISSWVENVVLRSSFGSPTNGALLSAISDALDAITAVLAIVVVRLLTGRLETAHERAAGDDPPFESTLASIL